MAAPTTVVLLPMWVGSHFTSLIDAGKRLLTRGGGRVTSLTVLVMPPPTEQLVAEVDDHIRREEASGGSGLDVRFVRLPAVEPPAADSRNDISKSISSLVLLHGPHVRSAISSLASPVAAVVVDFLNSELLDDVMLPTYIYFVGSASYLALILRLPSLHEEVEAGDGDGDGAAVDVPGLPPVPPSSLPNPVRDKNHPNYTWFVDHGRRFVEADGIIVNTAAELEQSVLAAIADGVVVVRAPTVYPVGPVISSTSASPTIDAAGECVRWLDAQPPASVVLLCFGGGGFFAAAQAHEIAHGLERSGHGFLWVLRGPWVPDKMSVSDANLAELLPEGFLERTRGRGLVWPTEAPQSQILAHAAVGGFVTHAGWNAVLESLWFGVPMAPWPLYSEHHLNALTLVVAMGVAVAMEVDRDRNNFVEAAELERAVRELMGGGEEGRKARVKAAEMRDACRHAVDEGGLSYDALRRLAEDMCKGHTNNNVPLIENY